MQRRPRSGCKQLLNALSLCLPHAAATVHVEAVLALQRWRGQAKEWRQKQLLKLEKAKHAGRLHVPDHAIGVETDDVGDPKVGPVSDNPRHVVASNQIASSCQPFTACLSVNATLPT